MEHRQTVRMRMHSPDSTFTAIEHGEQALGTQSSAIHKYFFQARCACHLSTRFPRALCLSSLTFILPASLFFQNGGVLGWLLGSLVTTLTMTSLAYHSTHLPWVRACDVSTILATALTGLASADASLLLHGINYKLITAHVALAFIIIISYNPRFHFRNSDGDGVISLQWHFIMHFLTTTCLTLIAFGL